MGLRDWWGRVFGSQPGEGAAGAARADAEGKPGAGAQGARVPEGAGGRSAADPVAALRKLPLPDAVARALETLEGSPGDADAAAVLRWLRGAVAAAELSPALRLRVADFFIARVEHAHAVVALAPLFERGDASALAAWARMAEQARERGDLDAVAAAYEQILAVDVTYPGVRERLSRLRAPARAGGAGATLISPDAARLAQGRLSLARELGRGGAGAVFLAHDARLGRDVALKIYHPAQRADRGARLRAEAQVAASLASRHVVRVYDLFESLGAVAMEFCPAGALRSESARAGASPAARLAWVRGVAHALAVTHERGWVHRDLKPGNVLLRADGTVALTDFGLARRSGATIEPLEGTAGYVAPEVRSSMRADPRIDVYAFGALGREVLGESPGEARGLLDACLSPDPAARPRDGAALLAWFEARGPGGN